VIKSQLLSQAEFFEGLSVEQLATIADQCEEVSCRQGEVLFRVGHKAERLYILSEGEIQISIQLSSRPERLTMSVIDEPGQVLGWSALVAPYQYTASALCKTDGRLLAIDGQALMQVLKQDPTMGFVIVQRLVEVIGARLRHTRIAVAGAMQL
jgi:CRP-like cAMP-binding protein